MKLLKCGDCHLPPHGGNVKEMTVMEEVLMEELSDAGSIPARSTTTLTVESLLADISDVSSNTF